MNRFQNGKIVEHWDNLQTTVPGPNASGHTMLDGPTVPTDLEHTAANKALVRSFVEDILIGGKLDQVAARAYFLEDKYIQHNPTRGDGVWGLLVGLRGQASAGNETVYTTLHKVLGEGNFVLAMSEGTLGGKPMGFYDIFRVENGKLAEHWDVIEAIPPRDEWKNENGKF